MTAPSLETACATDPGRAPDKQVNEDAWGDRLTAHGQLYVVCDGMGGHAGGREASTAAVATILSAFQGAGEAGPSSATAARDLLRDAIAAANARVWAHAPPDAGAGRPGSTVVALLVHEDGAEVAHVGDSRGYLVHAGQVFQLTRDHSMVQRMVDAQLLTPAQAAAHPDANRITRALGSAAEVEVELRPQPVRFVTGDVFILCTDGLSDLVGPEDLLRAVATCGPAARIAEQLVALANARGGHDNITALVARVGEPSRVASTRVTTTLVDATPPASRGATEPALPAYVAGELPRTLPPPVRRPSATTLAAIVLAVVGLAIAAVALWYGHR